MIGSASPTAPMRSMAVMITTAETTVIGAVGPLICVGVPPKIAAIIPIAIAP